MIKSIKKFKQEIELLKQVPHKSILHPLRKEQIKLAVLERIQQPGTRVFPVLSRRRSSIATYILAALLGFTLLTGTAFAASSSSRPGDALFPVKKVKEQIQLSLAVSEESKVDLQVKFTEERVKELKQIQSEKQGKTPTIKHTVAELKAEDETAHAMDALQTAQKTLTSQGKDGVAQKVHTVLEKLEQDSSVRTLKEYKRNRGTERVRGKDTEEPIGAVGTTTLSSPEITTQATSTLDTTGTGTIDHKQKENRIKKLNSWREYLQNKKRDR